LPWDKKALMQYSMSDSAIAIGSEAYRLLVS
jgi:hypothetical protein